MTFTWSSQDDLVVKYSRALAADAVQKVGNGHPGTAMSLAPVAYLLFQKHLVHDPKDPKWIGRDRFVLSCGHSSLTLYTQLFLSGYGLEMKDLQNFRTWDSLTPGHPEYGHTAGVEITTGPLGAGISTAVGMAMAQRYEKGLLDPETSLFDHRVYVICSDGDLQEGVSSEASSLAGTQELGNLVVIYDDNRISIEGDTHYAFTENVAARYAAYGWHVQKVDGHDMEAVAAAISLFGFQSGAALATVVGVLIEVPVMLLVVRVVIPGFNDAGVYNFTNAFDGALSHPLGIAKQLVTPTIKLETVAAWLLPFLFLSTGLKTSFSFTDATVWVVVAVALVVAGYVAAYQAYFAAHEPQSKERKTLLDPAPRVVLDPQLGLCAAEVTAEGARPEVAERGAQLRLAGPAEPARAAGDVEGDDDALADAEPRDARADGLDDADGLVADRLPRVERRFPVDEVQVGPADRGERDADDRVVSFLDPSVGDLADGHPVGALVDDRAHQTSSGNSVGTAIVSDTSSLAAFT